MKHKEVEKLLNNVIIGIKQLETDDFHTEQDWISKKEVIDLINEFISASNIINNL